MHVKKDISEMEDYLSDASNMKGEAESVYIPESESELFSLVSKLGSSKIPMTISSARTGLAGGAVPLGGAVISMEKLDRIIDYDSDSGNILVQPGARYCEIDKFLRERGQFLPPNPTEINSTIGGNISTNASGARTYKYGAMRNYVNSLKIITAEGNKLKLNRGEAVQSNLLKFESQCGYIYELTIKNINMPNTKNASGYYLKKEMKAIDLFIGSEGTLGIITEIELSTVPMPDNVMGIIAFFDSRKSLMDFVDQMTTTKEIIAPRVVEYFDSDALDMLRQKYSQTPICAGAIWLEMEYDNGSEDKISELFYEQLSIHSKLADDTWIAVNPSEHERFRDFRHTLPLMVNETVVNNKQIKLGTDTAVPQQYRRDFLEYIYDEFKNSELPSVVYGHIGNSHFHANLFVRNNSEKLVATKVFENITDYAIRHDGTVSAEHGIGKIKPEYLLKMYGQENIELMKAIKKALDPYMLLGRGNLFTSL